MKRRITVSRSCLAQIAQLPGAHSKIVIDALIKQQVQDACKAQGVPRSVSDVEALTKIGCLIASDLEGRDDASHVKDRASLRRRHNLHRKNGRNDGALGLGSEVRPGDAKRSRRVVRRKT